MLWVEKYRPQKFEEIIGLDPSIPSLALGKMPNFLFYGPAGTGKTTTAKVIISQRKAHYLQMNASDERGIDAIRERVKQFAMTKSLDGNIKIILLDEADQLTPPAFASLRGIMDTYQKNCRFILTCNWVNKIIDPIKSRCVCKEFKKPKKDDIGNLLYRICELEGVEYNEKGIYNIVKTTYPDIRRAIKELEVIYHRSGKVTEDTTNIIANRVALILESLEVGNFKRAIEIYEGDYIDEEILMDFLANKLFYGEYETTKKKTAMSLIRTAYVEMNRVNNKKLIIRPFLLQLMEVLK